MNKKIETSLAFALVIFVGLALAYGFIQIRRATIGYGDTKKIQLSPTEYSATHFHSRIMKDQLIEVSLDLEILSGGNIEIFATDTNGFEKLKSTNRTSLVSALSDGLREKEIEKDWESDWTPLDALQDEIYVVVVNNNKNVPFHGSLNIQVRPR